jgi:uncharacterized membrane protein
MRTLLMFVQKDLMQQGKRLLYGVAIVILFSIIAGRTNGAAIGFSVVSVLPATLAMSTIISSTYEDDQGGLIFLRLLPISPKWLVLGRYISVLIMLLGLYASALLPLLVMRPEHFDLAGFGAALYGSLCGVLFMLGVTFVVFYRYGYRAVRYGFLAVIFGIMMLSSLIATFNDRGLFSSPPPAWLETIFASPSRFVTVTSLVMLGIYALLWWAASNSLSKRDL